MRLYTLNPRTSRRILAPVASISAASGVVVVSQRHDVVPTATLEQGETLDCQDRGDFTVQSVNGGATVSVTYADEVGEERQIRGDADPDDGKATGSYESRPKKELYELAKERDLDVNSKSTKGDLIAALRGE